MKILIIEDDPVDANHIRRLLSQEGFECVLAPTSHAGYKHLSNEPFDAAVVDIKLVNPDGTAGADGIEIVQNARRAGVKTPVVFLTGISNPSTQLAELKLTPVEYITKPYSDTLVVQRVKNLIAASSGKKPKKVLRIGELCMDTGKRTLLFKGEPIILNPMQFRVLEYLMRNRGAHATAADILDEIWGSSLRSHRANNIEAVVSHIRSKLKAHGVPELIKTERGFGYVIY